MIYITTLWDGGYQRLADAVLPIRDRYARGHEYKTCFRKYQSLPVGMPVMEAQRIMAKNKIKIIIELLFIMDCKLIWLADLDGLITNTGFDISDYIESWPAEKAIFPSSDSNGMNPGSMIVKNTREALAFFLDVLKYLDATTVGCEGEAMEEILKTHPEYQKIYTVLPQKPINSYDYAGLYPDSSSIDTTGKSGQWAFGDFFIHWPGTTLEKRLQLFDKYSKLITSAAGSWRR